MIPNRALERLPTLMRNRLESKRRGGEQKEIDFDAKPSPPPEIVRAPEHSISTAQEATAVTTALANGHTRRGWETDSQDVLKRWRDPAGRLPHSLLIKPHSGELIELDAWISRQDATDAIIFQFINYLIAPPPGSPLYKQEPPPYIVIDPTDVARQCGLRVQTANERDAARRRVWSLTELVSLSRIVGERTYRDKRTDSSITINDFIWQVSLVWNNGHPRRHLFGSECPDVIAITPSPAWRRLATDHAQYIPGGERLGQIPAGKPAGALARSIGLALLCHWRRNEHNQARRTSMMRRELLDAFPIAATTGRIAHTGGNVGRFMTGTGDVPGRFVEEWQAAIKHLRTVGIVADRGEAQTRKRATKRTATTDGDGRPAAHWRQDWLNETVYLHPSENIVQMSPKPTPVSDPFAPQKKPPVR